MARYTGKKNRIARRFGINIFGRVRNPLLHKSNPQVSMERVGAKNLTTEFSWMRNKSSKLSMGC